MDPHDERQHDSTGDPRWVESWLFDLVHHDSSIAMSAEFIRLPSRGLVAFHASVLHPTRGLVSLVVPDAPQPRPPSLEVRAPGLWTDVGIQTALDHVTVDIEAFAVSLDDPDEVFRGAYGIRTALGCGLEWETADEIRPGPSESSYEVPCVVHGELLLDSDVIEIDGWGWRSHRWGIASLDDRSRFRGRSADGSWIHQPSLDPAVDFDIAGSAPVPDATHDSARLLQFLVQGESDVGWVRRNAPL